MYPLETSIDKLTRVGKATARIFKKLGVASLLDLIYYFPFRYDDFSQLVKISQLEPNQVVTISGRIILINNRRSFRKRMTVTEALVEDETGTIKIVWFNQPFLTKNLKAGAEVFISGKVEVDRLGLQFVSPAYEKINGLASAKTGHDSLHTAKIVPVYFLSGSLTVKQLRFLVSQALGSLNLISDWLPTEIIQRNNLMPLPEALKEIHFPTDFALLAKAKERLKFDELFLIQLNSQLNRKYLAKNKAPAISFKEQAIKEFVKSLPFTLTSDQKKASWQILLDLAKTKPANRLIEGDVGSGKTVVAALAILNVILNGYQAALMAPTEILAKQHFLSLQKLFLAFALRIVLLTSSEKLANNQPDLPAGADYVLDLIKSGQANLIIGTHALIEENVQYDNLGLVIVDEQHRFGVEQRKKLKKKNKNGKVPHFLSMTATPIPRSLALILYGDLDLSIIKEMPQGRKKIITQLVNEAGRNQAYQFMRQEIVNGQQAFVICPLIDPSDKLGVKSVKEEFKKLDKIVFPDLSIGLLHGKLKAKEKEEIMNDFKANKIKILVSTSVVEVGIDIPNATIMMIEGAERFGLAQLHQFRGRVGRGEQQSYCFLFAENWGDKVRERLAALVKSNDGFALAEYDLKFRGPGEVYGLRQSGLPDLRIASLNDVELINLTKNEANLFGEKNEIKNFPLLAQRLAQIRTSDHLE